LPGRYAWSLSYWPLGSLESPVSADEHVRQFTEAARQPVDLTEEECWRLLGGVSLGRIVFTMRAMPAIRPVNHVIDGQAIIVRTHLGSAITAHAAGGGAVVCYEADDLDPVRHTGWSVIATGMASLVTDPAEATRYRRMLAPWIDGEMDYVLQIKPQILSGLHLAGWCR
jgi:hypothetical protein